MSGAALAVCSALVFIGAVHLYWAVGGSVWKAGAIPSRRGKPLMAPRPASTALVGITLFGMTAIIGSTAGILPLFLPRGFLQDVSIVLALTFALRAIGEFHYIGFFKRVRGSIFAERDTYIYSPLCLVFAVLIAMIALV